jgi:hypothetical protein
MAQLVLLPPTTITAAGTTTTTPVQLTDHVDAEVMLSASFTYGSGGTSVNAYVQTTLDSGATWFDIANFNFLLASAVKISEVASVTVAAANYTPTDGTLAANTVKDGLIGSALRVKTIVVGTYAGNTSLSITAVTR